MIGALSGGLGGSQRMGRGTAAAIDAWLLIAVAALVLFGALMVYSASIGLADGPRYKNYGQYYFIMRHLIFISIGVVFALLAACVPLEVWQRFAIPLFLFTIFLLVLVLVPGIGREVNGSRRWLPLGPINFQPSELMKLVIIVYAADYVVRKQEYQESFKRSFNRGFLPMACALTAVGLSILLESDLGAFIVIGMVAMAILFIGGVNLKIFGLLLSSIMACFMLMIWISPMRIARMFVYMDPWNPSNAYGRAYQLSHSLIAMGRGELFGVGLGASVEKLHYLPEAHTDFIGAVIGEELGLIGITCLLALFVFIIMRGFDIARQCIVLDKIFAGLVAYGVVVWFAVQAFINMGVCLGLLPTKGLTLPLVSYGGSSIVMNLIAVALLMRVDFELRANMRRQK